MLCWQALLLAQVLLYTSQVDLRVYNLNDRLQSSHDDFGRTIDISELILAENDAHTCLLFSLKLLICCPPYNPTVCTLFKHSKLSLKNEQIARPCNC